MKVLDASGRSIELTKKLGEGGEGAVWASPAASNLAIKTYLQPMTSRKAEKLTSMASVAEPRLLDMAAWPTRIVFDPSKRPVGFEMPKLSSQRAFHDAMALKSRLKDFPNFDWKALVHTAGNLANAFHYLHERNIVVGDVNANNVVVYGDTRVFFIDCDSFQIRTPKGTFPCEVGVAEYQPPELQGIDLGTIERLPHHDAFGMAVMIFQLLFVGKHPFAGRLPNPTGSGSTIGENIAAGNYFYDARAQSRGLKPPPASLSIGAVTPAVAALFERAFRGRPEDRPLGPEWIVALAELEERITRCKVNSVHRHLTGTACPWCAIELASQICYFIAPALVNANGTIDESIWQTFPDAEVQRLWRAIDAVTPPLMTFEPIAASKLAPTPISVDLHTRKVRFQRILVALFVACVVVVSIPAVRGDEVWTILVTAAFWRFRRVRVGPELEGRRAQVHAAQAEFARAEAEWSVACNSTAFKTQKDVLRAARDAMLAQRKAYDAELATVARSAEQQARRDYLDQHFLRDAKIKGVGPSLKAKMASYNIETALDIAQSIMAIDGIGPAKRDALFSWRDQIDRQFRFYPQMVDGLMRPIKAKYVQQRLQGRNALTNGVATLRAVIARTENRGPELRANAIQKRLVLDQAEADLKPFSAFLYR